MTHSDVLPSISVLMAVYNGEKHLSEAIESILGQTLADFEFIIIEDGSSDKSLEIISSYNDSRIRLIKNQAQIGLAASLNKGVSIASGRYIARMDADDISNRDRLKKQYDFMETHPYIGVLGTEINIINEHGVFIKKTGKPLRHFVIKWENLFSSSMYHPTVMLRTELLKNHPYREDFKTSSEDHELWSRLLKLTRFANLNEPLLDYRLHASSATKNRTREELTRSALVSIKNMSDYIQIKEKNERLIKKMRTNPDIAASDLVKTIILYKNLASAYIQKENLNLFHAVLIRRSLIKIYWRLLKRFLREKIKKFASV